MKVKLTDPAEINQTLYRSHLLAEYVNDISEVGEDELQFYREQGYLAIHNFLTEQETEDARQAMADIIQLRCSTSRESFEETLSNQFMNDESQAAFPLLRDPEKARPKKPHVQMVKSEETLLSLEEKLLAIRKVDNYVDFDTRFLTVAAHSKLLRVIERIFGENPKLVQNMALLKPPLGGGEKPWHQDMAYRGLDYDKPVIGVWVALDSAEIHNGCMHVIPRSHMSGGEPHYKVRDWQLCDENVDVQKSVTVPLKPGGVLLFHGMMHHGTPHNFSPNQRWALQFHYAPESAQMVSSLEYKRMYTNEMSGAEC